MARRSLAVWLLPVILAAAPLLDAQDAASRKHRLKAEASFSPAAAAPGEKVELRLALEIDEGWHIYSPDHEGFSPPTVIKVSGDVLEPDGKLQFPDPVVKKDEVLGETTRYHEGKVAYRWPHRIKAGAAAGKHPVKVSIRYMACTQEICEPPRDLEAAAAIEVAASGAAAPAAATGAAPEGPSKTAKKPLDLGGLDVAGKAPPAAASKVEWTIAIEPETLRRGGRGTLLLGYKLLPGWHIYAPDHRATGTATAVEFDAKLARPAGAPRFPEPHEREVAGETERSLDGEGTIRFPFTLAPEAPTGDLELPVTVRFQTCTERTCDPPASRKLAAKTRVSEEAPLSGAFPEGIWFFLASAVGWGLLTLLMPCTYPMIPLTISYFTKQAQGRNTSVLPLALTYGAGIIVIFVLIGVLVGPVIVQFAADWKLNLLLALLFVVFALSLFGLFEIRLPSGLMNLSSRASRQGGYIGVFVLGATLVVVSFTCTAPFVGALLGTGAAVKSLPTIVLGMAVFGATIALPFAALAMFPSAAKRMPRSGEWMKTIKVTLGFVELAAAFKFLSNADIVLRPKYPSYAALNLLPLETFLWIWAAIAAITALYLLRLMPVPAWRPSGLGPVQVVFALFFLLLGGYCVQGAIGGKLDPVMVAIAPNYKINEKAVPWILVKDDYEGGLERARAEGKLALINWTGFT